MDSATFAAKREGRLASFDKELRPILERHLGNREYGDIVTAASVLWLETFEETAPSATSQFILTRFKRQLREILEKGNPSSPATGAEIDRAVKWIGAFAANDATYYGTRSNGQAQKRWVSMHDDDVRSAHRRADGQVVGIADQFVVDGAKFRYPGEPVGDPALWINCRCYVQPAGKGFSMTATTFAIEGTTPIAPPAEEEPRTGVVVVALVADSDPLAAASSEADGAHMTLAFLGDVSELADKNVDIEALAGNVADWAIRIDAPITEGIAGRAVLGKDKADVVLVDASAFAEIRQGIITEPAERLADGSAPVDEVELMPVARAYIDTEQFPVWTPHVTVGYPESPALADYQGESVTFDRIALWAGDDRREWSFGLGDVAGPADDPVADEPIVAAAIEVNPEALLDDEEVPSPEEMDELETGEPIPFHGVAAPTDTVSGDRRLIKSTGVSFRPFPLPLFFQRLSSEQHMGSVAIGRIDNMWVDEAGLIQYQGEFATNVPEVSEVIQGLAEGYIGGVSVDVDDITIAAPAEPEMIENAEQGFDAIFNPDVTAFETSRISGLTVVGIPAFHEAYLALGPCDCPDEGAPNGTIAVEGPEMTEEDALVAAAEIFADLRLDDELAALLPEEGEGVALLASAATFAPGTKDGPGWITHPKATSRIRRYWTSGAGAAKIGWGAPGDFNRCRSQLGKYVQRPDWLAGLCANMHKEVLGVWPGREGGGRSVVASGGAEEMAPAITLLASAHEVPDGSWFADPKLKGPTPFTITDDGRVFGHVATWGVCHIGMSGVCTTAPTSASSYSYFRTGLVETTTGDVAVGHITIGSGHANVRSNAAAAAAHYDNVATVAADVAAGEDGHGIWVAGALRPGVSEETRRQLKAAALSGDWRKIRGNMEMVAALAVNVPGFPIPRNALVASAAGQESLVAAGIVEHEPKPAKVDVQMSVIDAVADAVIYKQQRAQRFAAAQAEARAHRIALAQKGI